MSALIDRPTAIVNAHRSSALKAYRSTWRLSLTEEDKQANLFLWDRGMLTFHDLDVLEVDNARESFIFETLCRHQLHSAKPATSIAFYS